ncbi:MAG: response regulator [Deltaproteobacteria bacterium]|nr:response regulator [Deltaproteobacteria bacterium]
MAEKIVLAEDTGPLREGLTQVLTDAGYQVTAVGDGVSAEAAVTAGADLLVTDLLLPKKQGFALVEGLRGAGSRIPVVMITGVFKTAAQMKDAKDRLNVKEYLLKPFEADVFLAAVESALGKPPRVVAVQTQTAVSQEPLPDKGHCGDFPAALLMFRAQNERHTGVLDLGSDKERLRVFFYKGQVAMAQSNKDGLHVANELIKMGQVSAQGLQLALQAMQRDSCGLHKALLNESLVDEATAKEAYKTLVPRVLMDAAAFQGRFKWTATEGFAKLIPSVSVPALPVLFDAFKAMDAGLLEALLEKKKSSRLARGPNFDRYGPGIEGTLGPEVGRAINGRARLLQIVGAATTPEQRKARLAQAFALLCTQAALAVDEGSPAAAPGAAVVAPPHTPAPVAAPAEVSTPGTLPPMHRAPQASQSSVAVPRVAMAQAAAAAASATASAVPAAPARPPANVPPELQAILAEVEQRYTGMKDATHFEVLGVKQTDDPATVKKAYFALASKFHADKFSGVELGLMREKLDAVFARLSEANETLSKPDKRAEYETALKMQAAGAQTNIAAIFEAESQFTKGETVLLRGDFNASKKLFDRAMELDAKDLYRAYQLFAGFCAAGRPKASAAGLITELERLAELAAIPRVNEFLGHVAKAGENWMAAKKYFSRVAEDPQGNKAVAVRELQLIDTKLKDAAKGEKGGMFGKMFNKS